MSTHSQGVTDPGDQSSSPVPRRRFVEALLGTGFVATAVTFLYPVLRLLVPPKAADLGSDAVVAGRVGELKPNNGKIFRFGNRPGPARLAMRPRVPWLSGGAGEEVVDGDPPFFEEPFGNVDAVLVLVAPDAELARRGTRLGRQTQALDLQFELGGHGPSGRNGTPPVGVAALARACDRQRHRPDHTPQQVFPQENLHSGARGLPGIRAG